MLRHLIATVNLLELLLQIIALQLLGGRRSVVIVRLEAQLLGTLASAERPCIPIGSPLALFNDI